MLTIALCLALGVALSFVLPGGVTPGTKYTPPSEEEFEAMLRARGLIK